MLQRIILITTFLIIATILIPSGLENFAAGSDHLRLKSETNINSGQKFLPKFLTDNPANSPSFLFSFLTGEEVEEEEEKKAKNIKVVFGSLLGLIYSTHQRNTFKLKLANEGAIYLSDTPLFLFYGVFRL